MLALAIAAQARAMASVNRQLFVPANAGAFTIAPSAAATIEVYLNHTSAVAGLTITFPPPVDGQRVLLLWREAASSIAFVTGGTLLGAFASAAANVRSGWVYNAVTGCWHRYT